MNGRLAAVTRAPSPRIAVVQHEDGCPLGLFETWLRQAGAEVRTVRPYRGEPLPGVDAGDVDGIVVLGGSMSASDDERAPWLPATRALLRRAVDAGLPTLGVCLGHQLLAAACGGVVERNPAGRQMGVLPIGFVPTASTERLFGVTSRQGPRARAIQWNSDIVVETPADADVLAATPDGVPQVLRVGEAAWGVQFHPEADHRIVAAWAAEDSPVTAAESAALAHIAAAADELEATWRPFAERFAAIAADHRGVASEVVTSQ
jgi:GMP synthase (glutamine-hydrolysing)